METPAKSDKIENSDKNLSGGNELIDIASDEEENKADVTVDLSSDESTELINGTSSTSAHEDEKEPGGGDDDASTTKRQPEVFAFVGANHTREESPFPGDPPIKRPHSPEKLQRDNVKRKCEKAADTDNVELITLAMSADGATGPLGDPKSQEVIKSSREEDLVMVGDQQLPATVTKLESPNGGVVYLVGTAHFSIESQEDVAKVIQLVQPHIVTVELCKSRISLLQLDEETILREAKNINFSKIHMTMQQNGVLNGLMYILLLSLSANLTKQLGMAPGGEFRRAMMEAGKVPNCCVHLGDRPINITLHRALSSLSWWQTLKLAWHMIFSNDTISKEEVERCKQRDLLEEMLAEMAGEFPALGRVFVQERDLFLAHSLALACQPVSIPGGFMPAKVVGVVGIGHVPGIVQHWGRVTEDDIVPIMQVPQRSMTSRIVMLTFKASAIGLVIWGAYKILPVPRITLPKLWKEVKLWYDAVNGEMEDSLDPYSHGDNMWLVYTPNNIPGPGCDPSLFQEQISAGCSCKADCAAPSSQCSCQPNYSHGTLLNVGPIFECNRSCSCSVSSCSNRLVQSGPIFGLEIFDTKNKKGLGLRTTCCISKHSFICEYAGEVIGELEARLRARNQETNYIIVVNEHCSSGVITTRVDPTYIGNIGRYANHSCTPTAYMVPVRSNFFVPHLALFASQDLESGTEITFDYAGNEEHPNLSDVSCLCGSEKCRGFLPRNQALF